MILTMELGFEIVIVIEIDVNERVYWDCASIVRSMSKFGGVSDILAL